MKTYDSDAGNRLFGKIKAFGAAYHTSWRCIYLQLSEHPQLYNRMVHQHFVVRTITDALADIEGEVYVCDDGDVFVLFKGALRPVMIRLGGHFHGIMPDKAGRQPEDSLFTIFDLGKHWQVFFVLCKSKATPPSGIRTTLSQAQLPAFDANIRAQLELG